MFCAIIGIICVYQFPSSTPVLLMQIGGYGLLGCGLILLLLRRFGFVPAMALYAGAFAAGWIAAAWQLWQHPPSGITAPLTMEVRGAIAAIDGQFGTRTEGQYDGRLRLWIRIDERTADKLNAGHLQAGQLQTGQRDAIIRLSVKARQMPAVTAGAVRVRARLFPPSPPLFPGTNDYALQARTKNVIAGGYAVGPVHHSAVPVPDMRWQQRINDYRYRMSAWLVAHMSQPEGGIAAALLIGDKRYIPAPVYDDFRAAGLAHLLAISGLHMGLVCFGVIGFARACFALFPGTAARLPAHKYSAIAGILVTMLYVCVSGGATSALRAFLMATLLVGALMMDRPAITVRNVALAALALLLWNPAAILTASFQLSFAATTLLVLWAERTHIRSLWESQNLSQLSAQVPAQHLSQNLSQVPAQTGAQDLSQLSAQVTAQQLSQHVSQLSGRRWPAPLRYMRVLLMVSLLAAGATAPFAAQHFGTVTGWGVVANLVAIPLTALWIMPTGLIVMLTQSLPPPVSGAAMAMMEQGLWLLHTTTSYFASLPGAGYRVPQPGYAVIGTGLCGWLISALQSGPHPGLQSGPHPAHKGQTIIGGALIAVACVLWVTKKPPDIVIIANDRPAILYVRTANHVASVYAQKDWHKNLSRFYRDSASLVLVQNIAPHEAQKSTESDRVPYLPDPVIEITSDGSRIAIARERRALTKACRAAVSHVISFATPLYPCRNKVIDISTLQGGNHLIWLVQNGEIITSAQ